ncbi:MAG: hypothetical protein WA383_21395 [Terriglobales bacterium]
MARLTVVPKQQEPEISWRSYDRIEPGEYVAYCRAADVYLDSEFRRWVCRTQWTVFDDSRTNKLADLTKFFNLGEGRKPRATSRRSHYRQAWIAANGGQSPTRGSRMEPTIFVHRFARIEVADVEKDRNQMTLSADQVYSVVRRILSWETGEAHCDQQSRTYYQHRHKGESRAKRHG